VKEGRKQEVVFRDVHNARDAVPKDPEMETRIRASVIYNRAKVAAIEEATKRYITVGAVMSSFGCDYYSAAKAMRVSLQLAFKDGHCLCRTHLELRHDGHTYLTTIFSVPDNLDVSKFAFPQPDPHAPEGEIMYSFIKTELLPQSSSESNLESQL